MQADTQLQCICVYIFYWSLYITTHVCVSPYTHAFHCTYTLRRALSAGVAEHLDFIQTKACCGQGFI